MERPINSLLLCQTDREVNSNQSQKSILDDIIFAIFEIIETEHEVKNLLI